MPLVQTPGMNDHERMGCLQEAVTNCIRQIVESLGKKMSLWTCMILLSGLKLVDK